MSTLELKELSHPAGEVIKIAAGKTLDLKSQGTTTLPTGSVLQVVSAFSTTIFATTSTSYVDITGMAVSITPSSTSSKVLVQVIGSSGNNDAGYITMVQLTRNGTAIGGGAAASNRPSAFGVSRPASVDTMDTVGGVFLDSPSSTSAVVYKLQMKVQGATGTFNKTGRDVDASYAPRTAASIIVQEIQG